MIRLVLSDLDNTLIWGSPHVITGHGADAIRALQAAGVHFAPATGRTFSGLPELFGGDTGLCSTAITCNGQLVYLDGQLVSSTPLAHDVLTRTRDVLTEFWDAFLVVEYEERKIGIGMDMGYVQANPDYFWAVGEAMGEVPDEPCHKANVRVVGDMARGREVRERLAEACPEFDFVFPMPGFPHIDILPHGFGKERGGDFLMEALGLTPDEVAVFGDAENDMSMLEHYPNSVAVANAVPIVAQTARWHVGRAEDDAVADAFFEIARATKAGEMPAFMR